MHWIGQGCFRANFVENGWIFSDTLRFTGDSLQIKGDVRLSLDETLFIFDYKDIKNIMKQSIFFFFLCEEKSLVLYNDSSNRVDYEILPSKSCYHRSSCLMELKDDLKLKPINKNEEEIIDSHETFTLHQDQKRYVLDLDSCKKESWLWFYSNINKPSHLMLKTFPLISIPKLNVRAKLLERLNKWTILM
jgi:hypothetical protein